MGDINIVTQPTNPNEIQQALAMPAQPEATIPPSTPAQVSSTNEPAGATQVIDSQVTELLKTMNKAMESMQSEIQALKGSNAKMALAGVAESGSSTIEESLADFFGYNQ